MRSVLSHTKNTRNIAAAFVGCALLFLLFQQSFAQQAQPTIVLSWSADTLTPAGYTGKALPVLKSPLTISADMLVAGRIVDPRDLVFRWYINGLPKEIGHGKNIISFPVKAAPRTSIQVRLEIDYANTTFKKLYFIPVQEPFISIVPPYGDKVLAGDNVFRTIPYFFKALSTRDIIIQWYANGLRAEPLSAAEPFVLTIPDDYAGSNEIVLSAEASNSLNILEFASQRVTTTFTR